MYKKVCCTCKDVVLLIRPIVFFAAFVAVAAWLALYDFKLWYSKHASKNLLDENLPIRPLLYKNLLSLKCETGYSFLKSIKNYFHLGK